jgi:hypothetical protein
MSKNLFKIDESEKMRILEMHQSATNRHYLGEQVVPATTSPETTTSATTTTTTPKSSGIPGFTWAEDTTSWLTINPPTSNDLANEVKVSQENERRMFDYYRTGELVGKIALSFKGSYLKRNLVHQFPIFFTKPSTKKDGQVFIGSSADYSTPYLLALKGGKVRYFQKANSIFEDVESVLGGMVTGSYTKL